MVFPKIFNGSSRKFFIIVPLFALGIPYYFRSGADIAKSTSYLRRANPNVRLIAATIHPSATPIIEPSRILERPLQKTNTHEDVKVLQAAFASYGLLPYASSTGYYGPATEQAVKDFQKETGLPQTGNVDKITITKFNNIFGRLKDRQYYLSLIPSPYPPTPTSPPQALPKEEKKWGEAQKVEGSEYGYTMNVQDDDRMATQGEIFDALNRYRALKGVRTLNWDGPLASYAQQRAEYFNTNGLDEHRGFLEFVQDPEKRETLGFWGLGENASQGYRLEGSHLIEWVFAGDAPHENNQLNPDWTDVGVGVSGTSVDVIFGSNRM